MKTLIGLDLGTSASKGILITVEGEVVASCSEPTDFIKDGDRIEYDFDVYYNSVCNVLKTLSGHVVDTRQIMGISMAAASGNSLLVDESGYALTKVISWMDKRTNSEKSETLRLLHEQNVHEIVGWPAIPMFPLAHLSWFKENMADEYSQTAHYCMNTDYTLFRLTGEWGMDYL